MEMNIPVLVMASVYHEIDDRLAVMGNIGWQNNLNSEELQFRLVRQHHRASRLTGILIIPVTLLSVCSTVFLSPGCFPLALPMI